MSRAAIALIAGAAVCLADAAWASGGIPMAEQWSWARDGGRIINAVIVLGGVCYLVVRFGGPILRRRADMISERFAELEEARKKAETGLAEYEKKLKLILAEGEKIKNEAREEAELIRKKTLEQAERDATRIVEKAAEQISVETERARASLRRETTLAAIDLAEKLLEKNIDPEDQKTLLNDYLSRMEKMN